MFSEYNLGNGTVHLNKQSFPVMQLQIRQHQFLEVTAADEKPLRNVAQSEKMIYHVMCYQELHLSGLGLFQSCDK